jgi:spore coat protein H
MIIKNPIHTKQLFHMLLMLVLILLDGCRKDDLLSKEDVEQSDLPDWSEETHGNDAEPNYQVVFDHGEVLRIDILIGSEDWSDMQADLASRLDSPGRLPAGGSDPIWVPCSFHFNDTEWYHVGIRYKGNSSLRSSYEQGIEKLPLKLDFDQFEDEYPEISNQRFYGFRQLSLKNNFDDPSMVREKVGSDLFREFGLVSPRTAFCVVYLDHGTGPEYHGVYTLVEEVDDTVLDSQYGNSEGNLYKPEGPAASFAEGSYNQMQMEKKNNEELADYSDVYALYEILHAPDRISDTEAWKNALCKLLDVDRFLKWLAANIAMQNWDTYGISPHNYYLYHHPWDGLIHWIPWDNNEALKEGKRGGALSLSLEEVGNNWPLIHYLVDIPEYRQVYEDYLLEFTGSVFTPALLS